MVLSRPVGETGRRGDSNHLVMKHVTKSKLKASWLSILLVVPPFEYEPPNVPHSTIRHLVVTARNEALKSTIDRALPPIEGSTTYLGELELVQAGFNYD